MTFFHSNPLTKMYTLCFLFVRLYLMVFFALTIKDSLQEVLFLCLRMFLEGISPVTFAQLSSITPFLLIQSALNLWMLGVRLSSRMQRLPRKSETRSQCWLESFFFSVSYVNSISSGPNVWKVRCLINYFHAQNYRFLYPSIAWSYSLL